MSAISITFSTPAQLHFNWYDSLESLTDEELEELTVHCRGAMAALFTELSDRRKSCRAPEAYSDMLLRTAKYINRVGFTKDHESYLRDLYLFLAEPDDRQIERSDLKVVRQFLWLISRLTNWSYALLILCTLGKHKMQVLNEHERTKLTKSIIKHRADFQCPRLEDKASQCNLQQIGMNLPRCMLTSTDSQQVSKTTLRELRESASATTR